MRSTGGLTSIWCFQGAKVQNTCESGRYSDNSRYSDTCHSCLSEMQRLSNSATRKNPMKQHKPNNFKKENTHSLKSMKRTKVQFLV